MTPTRFPPHGDLRELAHVHALSFADAWSAPSLGQLLAAPGTIAFTAGTPVEGFILVRTMRDESEILTLAVAPAARRKGLGVGLVREAARWAQANGAATLYLEVAVSNVSARTLYAGLGFAKSGMRKGYYRTAEGRLDALVLRVDLPLEAVGIRGQLD